LGYETYACTREGTLDGLHESLQKKFSDENKLKQALVIINAFASECTDTAEPNSRNAELWGKHHSAFVEAAADWGVTF